MQPSEDDLIDSTELDRNRDVNQRQSGSTGRENDQKQIFEQIELALLVKGLLGTVLAHVRYSVSFLHDIFVKYKNENNSVWIYSSSPNHLSVDATLEHHN